MRTRRRSHVSNLVRVTTLGTALALSACTGSAPQSSTKAQPFDGTTSCPATPAPQAFANALCVCGDLALTGAVTTHAASGKASVGVNGKATLVGSSSIDGDFVAWKSIDGVGGATMTGSILTNGDVQSTGAFDVAHDFSVGGNLVSVGSLDVQGALRVAGQNMHVGAQTVGSTAAYSAPTAPPCGCDPSTMLDVAAAVAQAKTQNDDAKVSLPSGTSVGASSTELPTGVYYLQAQSFVGSHQLHVTGAVALYVDGDLDQVGADQISIDSGATLDLYVNGSVKTVGALEAKADPGAFRIYIGGANAVELGVGAQDLDALVYAPSAQVSWVGSTTLHGALIAGSLGSVGALDVSYDAGQTQQPQSCNPSSPSPTPGSNQSIFTPIQ